MIHFASVFKGLNPPILPCGDWKGKKEGTRSIKWLLCIPKGFLHVTPLKAVGTGRITSAARPKLAAARDSRAVRAGLPCSLCWDFVMVAVLDFFFSFLREDGGEILDDIQKWDSWWQRCHLISLQVVTCLKLLRTQSQTFLPRRVTVPGTWNSQTGLQRAEWGVRTAPASSPPARSPSASSLGKGYVTWLGRPG